MSITNEIKNIDSNSAAGVGMFFFSMLGPGFLTIFLFKRDIFVSLDTVKLIILALSVASPGVILPMWFSVMSSFVYVRMLNPNKDVYGTSKEWFYRHAFGNAINMYIILFLSYVFSWSLLCFAWLFLVATLVMCFFEARYLFKRARNPERYPPMQFP